MLATCICKTMHSGIRHVLLWYIHYYASYLNCTVHVKEFIALIVCKECMNNQACSQGRGGGRWKTFYPQQKIKNSYFLRFSLFHPLEKYSMPLEAILPPFSILSGYRPVNICTWHCGFCILYVHDIVGSMYMILYSSFWEYHFLSTLVLCDWMKACKFA